MMGEKLKFKIAFAYALPAFSLAVIGIPIYIYIPKFYTDVMGVPIGIVGYIVLAVRLFDAFTDPMMGHISDNTVSSYGRRRPYITFGVIFLSTALYLLFNPLAINSTYQTLWFGILIFLVFLGWTIVVVPYESLGPEITFNYNERTFLFGLRDGFLIGGTLFAASLPLIIKVLFSISENSYGEQRKFFIISTIYIPLLLLSCWWCVFTIKERKRKFQEKKSILTSLRSISKNRPFIILLSSFTISAIGSNLPAALILYYVQYVLKSTSADIFLFEYFVVGIVFLPLWIIVAQKIGKKRTWLISMAINTGSFIGVFFLGAGDIIAYGVLVFFSGIGFGATIAIPSAIQADVIDYDELYTGRRREGEYVGIWSIFKKLAAALGVGVSFIILGFLNYKPGGEQTPSVILFIRIMYALVPCLCNIAAFFIACKFPISSDLHEKIISTLERRKGGEEVFDPLNPDIKLS